MSDENILPASPISGTIEPLGQFWCLYKHPVKTGWVSLNTSVGKLVLCEKYKVKMDNNYTNILYEPITLETIPELPEWLEKSDFREDLYEIGRFHKIP